MSQPVGGDSKARTAESLLTQSLDVLDGIEDPMERLEALSYMVTRYRDASSQAADLRARCMRQLNDQGVTYEQLAIRAGVTKPRIQQIMGRAAKPNKLGRLTYSFSVRAGELRGGGFTPAQIAQILVPEIRRSPGGKNMTVTKIAEILGASESEVEDAELP